MATEPQEPETSSPQKYPATQIPSSVSLKIWPPSQRTRDAVTNHLIQNLTDSSSILIKRHGGVFPQDSASAAAVKIEKEAYAAADSDERSKSEDVEAGILVLELYSKEISRRMIDFVNNSRKETDETKEADKTKEVDETGAESVEYEGQATAAA